MSGSLSETLSNGLSDSSTGLVSDRVKFVSKCNESSELNSSDKDVRSPQHSEREVHEVNEVHDKLTFEKQCIMIHCVWKLIESYVGKLTSSTRPVIQ